MKSNVLMAWMASFLIAVVASSLRAVGQEAPRYKLSVGQEVKYDSVGDSTYQSGSFHSENHWTAWVIRKNDDGSFRVVLRQVAKFQQILNGRAMGRDEPMTELAYIDLFPDGRFDRNDSLGFQVEPTMIFPKLPTVANAGAWEQEIAFGQLRFTADPAASKAGEFVFRAEQQSAEAEIYLVTNSNVFHFDRERGLVSSVENRNSQGYGFKSKGEGKTTLAGVETRPADWLGQFDKESQVYFDAMATYRHETELAEADPARAAAHLSQAEQDLRSARAKLTIADLTRLADEQIARHSQMAGYIKERSEKLAQVLNHPAGDWSLEDLAGKTHSLADYRGKVVLLDFWYRGCGWCMRAMPQVKQVVSDFKNEPVVVLGMNTDRDKADAQFVVDKMQLNYEILRADQSVPQKYGVQGYPTLIIIDQQGIVRDVHVGYSPDLREKVEKVVRKLLPTAG
jgi:thiol-disulfide isomerase/thioredoxin